MIQQINLYRPIFRKQEKKFSALAMLQAGGAIIVGIAVIYGVMLSQVRGMRSQLRGADRQLLVSTRRLQEATRRFGPGTKSQLLQQQVADLEKQVAARERVRELLHRGIFSNTTGYSDFFDAFARRHIPGVWLTHFDIVGAGEEMQLQGRASDPALVPRYLQRLSAEPALAGRQFQVFVMSRPREEGARGADARYVQFLFRSAPAKKKERP